MAFQRSCGDRSEPLSLDLSGQSLRKLLPTHYREPQKISILILDHNEIQKLEHIDKFSILGQLSASHNHILRMYHISNLVNLVRLDLSYNSIVSIEGLKGLIHLNYLNLSNNKIKVIERLQTNVNLEHLDLSENNISGLSNISDLRNLKKLFLHRNAITQLRHAELYFPKSLVILTLAGNRISDLAEVSRLVALPNLTEISFISNPCVDQYMGKSIPFDYRIYLINWCIELKVIDGFAVDEIERLKAEWLYSQGKGRKFKPGQHNELVKYLIETCPINNRSLMTENERKLRLILSKAHQHQKQLKLAEQPGSEKTSNSELMTRSLDNSLLECCSHQDNFQSNKSSLGSLTRSLCESSLLTSASEESVASYKSCISRPPSTISRMPLPAATKLVPVPESLVSPLVANAPSIPVLSKVPASTKVLAPSKIPASSKLPASGKFLGSCKVLASSKIATPDKVADDKLQNIKLRAQIKKEKLPPMTEEIHRSKIPTSGKFLGSHKVLASSKIASPDKVADGKLQNINQHAQIKKEKISPRTKELHRSKIPASGKYLGSHYVLASSKFATPDEVADDKLQNINLQAQIKKETISHTTEELHRSKIPALGKYLGSHNVLTSSKIATLDKVADDKLHNIKLRAQIKKEKNSPMTEDQAAVCIQRHWRGYNARRVNPCIQAMQHFCQAKRTYDHIQKLSMDVEAMRAALDCEHKLQVLQMQATKALWKKVQDLQECMEDVVRCVSPCSSTTISTQTDITALHSPTQETHRAKRS